MINHNKFNLSDYAAQQNQGWRVRWAPDGMNMVLLVNTATPIENSQWKLVWCEEDPCIILRHDGAFVPREGVLIQQSVLSILSVQGQEDVSVPHILQRCYKDHYQGVPAPRRKLPEEEPYITAGEAEILEQKFFDQLVAPYIHSHAVYAIDRSGVLLAKRLGVNLEGIIHVKHYASSTYQDDESISVDEILIDDIDKPVLIIDDMVSSGHTAAAVIDAMREAGIDAVRFVTLFDIVASRENHDVTSMVESIKPISNHYWMYGRGMDLLDEKSRQSGDIYGSCKSFATDTDPGDECEEADILLEFFKKRGW